MNPFSSTPRRQAAILNFLRWAAVLVLVFLLLTGGYWLYANVLNRAPADVYIAQRGTAVSAVYGTVTITADAALNLVAQNAGYLHETAPNAIDVQGAIVKKDQLLATITDEVGQRGLAQARNDYEAALARQKVGPPTRGVLKSAEDTNNAYLHLPNPTAVPKVQRDAAQNEVNRLAGIVKNEEAELQHAVDITASVLKANEDNVKRTEIRAPFDGILTVPFFNDNAYVLPNQVLFTVATRETYIAGQVNEEDVGQLRHGMKAEVRLYAYGSTTLDATLDAVLPSPDANSSRYTVTLALDHPPDNLMYGETGEMNIILGRKPDTLVIPTRALQVDQVLIVDNGIVEQRTVKAGFRSLEFVEILDGVNNGDAVIVADQDTFRVGQRVRAVPINTAKPPAKK